MVFRKKASPDTPAVQAERVRQQADFAHLAVNDHDEGASKYHRGKAIRAAKGDKLPRLNRDLPSDPLRPGDDGYEPPTP